MTSEAVLTIRAVLPRRNRERWLGRPCHVTSYTFERDDFGKRIEVRQWLDTGTMDLDAVMGYGSHIHRFERKVDVPSLEGPSLASAVQAMADRVFGD